MNEEKKKQIVEQIVNEWNSMVNSIQNTTIRMCLRIKEILEENQCNNEPGTVKEILEQVKKHPNVKQFVSIQRIWQGMRLIKNRPDLIEYNNMTEEQKQSLSFDQKPYLKNDGEIFWEFYFELEKAPFDNMRKRMIEHEGKSELWSFRDLRRRINEIKEEIASPAGEQAMRKRKKRELLKEINSIIRSFTVEDLEKVSNYVKLLKNEQRQA